MVINELQIRRRVQIIFSNFGQFVSCKSLAIENHLESPGVTRILVFTCFYKFSNICDLVKNNRLEGLGNGQGGY